MHSPQLAKQRESVDFLSKYKANASGVEVARRNRESISHARRTTGCASDKQRLSDRRNAFTASPSTHEQAPGLAWIGNNLQLGLRTLRPPRSRHPWARTKFARPPRQLLASPGAPLRGNLVAVRLRLHQLAGNYTHGSEPRRVVSNQPLGSGSRILVLCHRSAHAHSSCVNLTQRVRYEPS